ncbi:FAD-dependent oxidoreductase [Aspergillus novofumigatus IBT 16806]|uniref:FAD/NAD(P)-binding domain-containing protein n=1 Tax=Aspergillus novofumigatus (strain IBT 16806) TaxID=1392255 RepID=A0A2I1CCR8_ASPN1|nr:FAD/NAD(P)-binding domain-containing protein [Aspergillus novofumigatus IBT 16806]PKX95412.1 FAD/NAD(P)-binding domain-containing protein [Aspergillus novofumigatus IBT 16806]
MAENSARDELRVLIIGGSIAGLTLAHALSALNASLQDDPRAKTTIRYTVLEKRSSFTPQEGASIGILPHGGRILDQLGLFKGIEDEIEPLHTAHLRFPGRKGYVATNESPRVVGDRFGLPFAFLERRTLLRILTEGLGIGGRVEQQGNVTREGGEGSQVLCDKEVVRVEFVKDKGDYREAVSIRTKDGRLYKGDLVVGCDGVHSIVRREMWRISAEEGEGIEPGEKKALTAEYACIYGISSAVPGFQAGEHVASLNNKRSFLTFPGSHDRTFWFLIWKLDRKYVYADGDMPRFTATDTASVVERYAEDIIWGEVTFRDLWDRRTRHNTTVLEENVFDTWHYKRIVCIGDSIHKIRQMAPNTGQGANCAIEDAASLANLLHEVLISNQNGKPSTGQFDRRLRQYTAERNGRVDKIYSIARTVVRLHARDTLYLRFFGRYVLPYSGDLPARAASKTIKDAPKLDFIPVSTRVANGWNEDGTGGGSIMLRVVLGFIFVLGATWTWRIVDNPFS